MLHRMLNSVLYQNYTVIFTSTTGLFIIIFYTCVLETFFPHVPQCDELINSLREGSLYLHIPLAFYLTYFIYVPLHSVLCLVWDFPLGGIGRHLITNSIPLLFLGLFRLAISPWFRLVGSMTVGNYLLGYLTCCCIIIDSSLL